MTRRMGWHDTPGALGRHTQDAVLLQQVAGQGSAIDTATVETQAVRPSIDQASHGVVTVEHQGRPVPELPPEGVVEVVVVRPAPHDQGLFAGGGGQAPVGVDPSVDGHPGPTISSGALQVLRKGANHAKASSGRTGALGEPAWSST